MVRSRLALLVTVLLALAVPAHGQPGQQRLVATDLAPGVSHEMWTSGTSGARVHLARVDTTSPAALRVVPAQGGVRAGRETPTSICRRTRGCVAALNGDFFTAEGPIGGVISDRRLLRSPIPQHEQLSLLPVRATSGLDWSGVLRAPDGAEVVLDGVNVRPVADGVVLYTSSYASTTPACTCFEVVLTELGEPVGRLGLPTPLARTGQAAGRTPLPESTVVVAAAGAAAERLQAVASSGGDLTVTLSVAEPTEQSLGVHPVLLRDGQVAPVDRDDPMLRDPHPRSVVAWDGAGALWLAAFEGRRAGRGPTADELVAFLQRLGATDAVMLDGGGSTSLATADGPLNRPGDGVERPVSNALVVTTTAVAALRSAAPAPVAVPPDVVPVVAAAQPPAPVAPAPEPVAPAAPPAAQAKPVVVEALPTRLVLSPTALDPRWQPSLVPALAAPPASPPVAVLVAAVLSALAALAWVAWGWLAVSPVRWRTG